MPVKSYQVIIKSYLADRNQQGIAGIKSEIKPRLCLSQLELATYYAFEQNKPILCSKLCFRFLSYLTVTSLLLLLLLLLLINGQLILQ